MDHLSKQFVHNKIINAAAKAVLRPLGVHQKGRSRLWYDDGRWYTVAIEFQPSSWMRGSYLNVGIQWLWHPKEFWSFDLGFRERKYLGSREIVTGRGGQFVQFKREDSFREAIDSMAGIAAERVRESRAHFQTLSGAYDFVRRRRNPRDERSHLDAAILAALCGHPRKARSLIRKTIIKDSDQDRQASRNRFALRLLDAIGDEQAYRRLIEAQIAECRALLKLEPLTEPVLPAK